MLQVDPAYTSLPTCLTQTLQILMYVLLSVRCCFSILVFLLKSAIAINPLTTLCILKGKHSKTDCNCRSVTLKILSVQYFCIYRRICIASHQLVASSNNVCISCIIYEILTLYIVRTACDLEKSSVQTYTDMGHSIYRAVAWRGKNQTNIEKLMTEQNFLSPNFVPTSIHKVTWQLWLLTAKNQPYVLWRRPKREKDATCSMCVWCCRWWLESAVSLLLFKTQHDSFSDLRTTTFAVRTSCVELSIS